MDINKEIQKATDKFIQEKLPDVIQLKVGNMVDAILEDAFRSYGDLAKQVKETISKGLNINLEKFNMLDYNHLVSKAINDRLIGIVNEQAIDPIIKLVESTVGFLEIKEMKVSDIHEKVIDAAKNEASDENEGEISFHVIENKKHAWTEISFDLEAEKQPSDCSITFLINKDSGNIFSFRSKSWWSKKGVVTPSKITQFSNLEHEIFRLYSAGVKIVIDENNPSNEWSRDDY